MGENIVKEFRLNGQLTRIGWICVWWMIVYKEG